MGTRVASGVLALSLLCGPAALVWRAFDRPAPPAAAPAAGLDERLLSRRSVAGEVAATFVRRWLTNTSATPDALNDLYPGQITFPKTAPAVGQVSLVNAVASAPGMWATTIGADVTPAGGVTTRRYYQVLMRVDGEGSQVSAAPAALPAPVAGPAGLRAAAANYSVSVNPTGALGSTVRAFLEAELTGAGDVSRYTSPGAPLRALGGDQGAYPGITVREIHANADVAGAGDRSAPSDGQTVHVVASYELLGRKDAPESGLSASATLGLTARGGRWEVSSIDPAFVDAPPAGAS